jgi:type IV pilus assembly protein PilM
MEDYITQYQIISEFFEEKTKMIRVLVTSLERRVVEAYLDLIKNVGLKPYVLDIHFNTISKFFDIYDKDANEDMTVAVVDIGYDGTDVTILQNGKYCMSRTIDHGSNTLVNLFEKELNLEFNEQHVEFVLNKGDENQKKLVRSTVDFMIDEISDIIRYHISRDSRNKVDNVFITGGISSMKSLVAHIVEQIGIELYEFEILDRVLVGYDGSYDIPSYINVLGSLVRR